MYSLYRYALKPLNNWLQKYRNLSCEITKNAINYFVILTEKCAFMYDTFIHIKKLIEGMHFQGL